MPRKVLSQPTISWINILITRRRSRRGDRDPIIGEAIVATKGAAALARALSINVTSVYAWRRVPRGRVLAVENATGIPRNLLRPDLYPTEVAGATVSGSPVT